MDVRAGSSQWAIAITLASGACVFQPPGNDAPPMLAGAGDGTADDAHPPEDSGEDAVPPPLDDGDGGRDTEPVGDDGSSPAPGEESDSGGVATDCPRIRVKVSAGASLNVRSSPSTLEDPIGELPNRSIADVLGEALGEPVQGTELWFHVATAELEGFVSAAYAECTFDEPPELLPPEGFWLPLECGVTATVSQGNFGAFDHEHDAAYAFDFALGIGMPMVAIADGIVIHRYDATGPASPCWEGGAGGCAAYANLVTLLHGDGTTSLYKHLSDVLVSDGEFVPRGRVVGRSGATGETWGPHAHVARQEDCGAPECVSIELEFVDAGVPATDATVTSGNCP